MYYEHSERTFEDIQQKPSRPNTPPTVRILPERPTSRDALYAKVESQRTTATHRYRWFINGELLEEADGSELAAGTARRGDTVLLEVAIITDAGTSPFGGYSVVIANAAPTCINAVISPAPPTTYQTIRCECLDPDDPDDDQLDSKCSWTGLSLDTDACEVSPETPLPTGTELECTLTLSDSSSTSSPTRATTAIANAPPQGGEARLVPQTITESTHVHCEADGAYDPDGVVWDYALSVDDIVLANGPNATLNGDNFNKGQTIGCIATPSDGLEGGTALPMWPHQLS